MQAFFESVGSGPLIAAVAAFLFGLLAGWLIWGVRMEEDDDFEDARDASALSAGNEPKLIAAPATQVANTPDDKANADQTNTGQATPRANGNLQPSIDALGAEISALRKMIDDEADAKLPAEELLTDLESSLKRANGRLKLIAQSLDNRATEDQASTQ
ncbi:MAG: hypothetical protein AAF850_09510 [Pseudomonadota bacterium]